MDRNKSTPMNGEQRLEMAKMWFDNAKNLIDDIREDDRFVESYFKDIDTEMKLCREEIKKTEDELQKVTDKDTRTPLLEKLRFLRQR